MPRRTASPLPRCRAPHGEREIGWRGTYRNRIAGLHVIVYDAEARPEAAARALALIDFGRMRGADDHRWLLHCEAHDTARLVGVLKDARWLATEPQEWCRECRAARGA